PLYRYDPRVALEGKNPLKIESKPPKISFQDYAYMEARYKMLTKSNPQAAKELMAKAEKDVQDRWKAYEALASDGNSKTQKPPLQKSS
ncbi:MAG: hypothetical protein WBD30_03845, partial [Bacteroidota bacterium]